MKRVCSVLLVALGFSLTAMQASAQVSVSINIGNQPTWGPVGYDRAEYYYLPDVEAYYYVPRRQFIYLDAGRWVFAANLPARCRNYDLYSGYKVVINDPRPYDHFYDHRNRYGRYRNYQGRQVCIRDQRGPRYDDRDNRDGRYGRDDRYDRDRRNDHDDHHDHGRNHGRGRGHGRGNW